MTKDLCVTCKHYVGGQTCLAFDHIPNEIISGNNDHTVVQPGQFDRYVYEKKKDVNEFSFVPDRV